MAWNKVVLNAATGSNGWVVFLEQPNSNKPVVNVMTEKYVRNMIPFANAVYMRNMGAGQNGNPDYQPPADHNPDKLISDLHTIFLQMGFKDRTPHAIELADQLFDFNEEEPDANKKVIEVKKRYQLVAGGTLLVPPYPELLPTLFLPLPTSPI